MAETKMSLKLLVDKSSDKVLFAEAGKEVVDFLLGLLTLPLAAVIKLLAEQETMVGSIANVYQTALHDLDESYFQSSNSKSAILKIANSHPPSTSPKGVLLIGNSAVGAEGYVKGMVTYMIMDDLTVTPMSCISSIAILNRVHVKNVAALQEKTVTLGVEQGLKLLKASLQSKTVLTDAFLSKQYMDRAGSTAVKMAARRLLQVRRYATEVEMEEKGEDGAALVQKQDEEDGIFKAFHDTSWHFFELDD